MPKLKFTVDSALLSELGEKLVESVHIALLELVKNSYDADATQVYIDILPQENCGPVIKISDNGTGMNFEGVKNYWMKIATHHKEQDNLSEIYRRTRTGSKGIGRFACKRLGQHLELTTIAKAKSCFEKTEIKFDWNKFKKGKDISSIECFGSLEKLSKTTKGTTLIISNAQNDEWKQRGYEYFKRQLALLAAIKAKKHKGAKKEDPGFNIYLRAPGFEGDKVLDLREELIKAGWGVLKGKVDSTGIATYTLDALGLGKRLITNIRKFPDLYGVEFTIGIIPGYPKESHRNPSLLAKYTVTDILKNWGGVQVRYNSFRVYPYGEEHDDWLKIDHDRGLRKAKSSTKQLDKIAISLKNVDTKRYLLNLLSNRNHLGWVDVDTRASGFELKTSREGFLRSQSVDKLREFVRFGIDWATIYRDYFMRMKTRSKVEHARQRLELISNKPVEKEEVVTSAVEYLNEQLDYIADALPLKDRKKLQKDFSEVAKTILSANQSSREEMHHLRLIAASSTLLPVFAHEVNFFVGGLGVSCERLELLEKELPASKAKLVRDIRDGLEKSQKRFKDLLELTSLVGIESKDEEPQRLAIKDRVGIATKCFQLITDKTGITIDDSEIPNDLLVGPMQEAELYAILLNSLSNSIKAVIAGSGEKKIGLKAQRKDGKVKINIMDTGIGLSPENFDDVFTPFVADPQNKLYKRLKRNINPEDMIIVGSGSGLGLSIAKEIVGAMNGSIKFVEPEGNWKTNLEVELP